MNQNRDDTMKGNFSFGKRLLSAALAAAMAATAMGTQAFAQPEETEESAQVQPSRVVSWSWPEEAGLDWSEEDQAWLLSCVYSEEQPLTEETLTQLLPGQITAVVQAPSVSQPESTPVAPAQEEPAVVDTDTVEDLTVVEENVSTFETAATPDTAASDSDGEDASSAPEEDTVVSEEMEAGAVGTVSEQPQTLTLDLIWDFSGLSFPLQPGEYSFSAGLPQGYLLDQNAPALKMTLTVTGGVMMMANDIQTRASETHLQQNIVSDIISPSNVTIDLFDYADPNLESNFEGGVGQPSGNINKDHQLQFNVNGQGTTGVSINHWTSNPYYVPEGNSNKYAFTGAPLPGIVKRNLNENGYPVLKQGNQYNAAEDETVEENLDYLFDGSSADGKLGYYDVEGLLQLNSDTGIMSYDSQQNFAEFDKDEGKFILYNKGAVNGSNTKDEQNGQFFPFNTGAQVFYDTGYNDIAANNINSGNSLLNHYFGMHMKAYFMQPEDGKLTNNNQPMKFEFSGDDDVWVFIDGVLIGDVGGIHDRVELSIDFSTGEVNISCGASYKDSFPADKTYSSTTTIREMVQEAERESGVSSGIALKDDTLADNTYHTLDFFYLERGGNNSNLKLQTNLVEIPVSSVIKVDQLGKAIPNVSFELYRADKDYNEEGAPIATGKTDNNGTLVLENNGQPINFGQLVGSSQDEDKKYFVLKEVAAPSGYRSTGDIYLHYEQLGEHKQGVLLSANSWESGS